MAFISQQFVNTGLGFRDSGYKLHQVTVRIANRTADVNDLIYRNGESVTLTATHGDNTFQELNLAEEELRELVTILFRAAGPMTRRSLESQLHQIVDEH